MRKHIAQRWITIRYHKVYQCIDILLNKIYYIYDDYLKANYLRFSNLRENNIIYNNVYNLSM